jgi:membrane associated rhomboid family serine protease
MRYYSSQSRYRVGFGSGVPSAVKWLLIINVAVFVLLVFDKSGYLISQLGLTPYAVVTGPLVYQVFTYMFLHSPFSILHILFNMLMLWMFGSEIERLWGTRKFLKFYLLAGTVAGIFSVIVSPMSQSPIIGASGAILGLLVVFAILWPNRQVYVYFLIPVKVKYLIIFIVGIDLLFAFSRSSDGVAHWTHLGGALFGLAYMRGAGLLPFLSRRVNRVRVRKQDKKVEKMREESDRLMDEVDRILDKINDVGIDKLTDKERRILEKASSHLSKKRR